MLKIVWDPRKRAISTSNDGSAIAQDSPGSTAPEWSAYRHTLDPAPLSTVYSRSDTTCAKGQIPAGSYFFKSTGIIDPTDFVGASYIIDP